MYNKMSFKQFPDYHDFDNGRVTLGALDLNACILYLNCSRLDYERDYRVFNHSMAAKGYVRVFFHELTHYFQINTTTNGMYISQLEDFQIVQVQQIIHAIGSIKYPIISDMIINHPMENNKRAWYHLRKWYAAELLKCAFNCDFVRYQYLASHTVFSDESLADIYLEIDEEMSRLYQTRLVKRKITDKMPEIPLDLANTIKKSSSPFENHARIAEFWWDPKDKQNPYGRKHEDLFEYSGWIERFLKRVHIGNFQDFVSSFLAICELTQFAPVLPGIDAAAETSIYDYIPIYRMARLIDVAQDVRPMEGINDYNRYICDLCRKSGYTEARGLCKDILMNRTQPVGKSFWVDLFYEGIQTRCHDFSTFSYYGLWHPLAMEVEPVAREFTRKFVPPLICYNDCCYNSRTVEDSNSEAFSVVIRNVFRRYVSAIMTGWERVENGKMYIVCPVMATELEKQYVEFQVNRFIEERLQIKPNLKIV